MWEKQSLPQKSHLCVVSCRLELLHSFLQALLSTSAFTSFFSPVLRCWFRVLHIMRSAARSRKDSVLMSKRHTQSTRLLLNPNPASFCDSTDRTGHSFHGLAVHQCGHRSRLVAFRRLGYRGLQTRKVYLDYITCLRYTILVSIPRYVLFGLVTLSSYPVYHFEY